MTSYYDIAVIKSFWLKLLKVIMNYLTLDGHYTRVYGHHFVILNHFCHGVNMSFPFYLMSALRANFSDHCKNSTKFPILHEILLVLIDAHFSSLPPPDDYIHIISENDESSAGDSNNEASGSGSEEISPPLKKAKMEIPLSSKPKMRKGIKGRKNIGMSSPSTSTENGSPSSSEKAEDDKNLDCPNALASPPSYKETGNVGVVGIVDLHPKSDELNDKREDYENVMGMTREHAIDTFSLFKLLFHELKEIRINQRALGSKMDDFPAGSTHGNLNNEGNWTEAEKELVMDCIKKTGEGVDQLKKRLEKCITYFD